MSAIPVSHVLSKTIVITSLICMANGLWTGLLLGLAIPGEVACATREESCVAGIILFFIWLYGEAFLAIPTLISGIVLIVERSERAIHWVGYVGLTGLVISVGMPCALLALELLAY